jgi:hypothetical protein
MLCEGITRRVVFVALVAFFINGGAIVCAQVKSSTFYSTYDAHELVKNKKYKGIDFAQGEMGTGTSLSELPGGRNENSKSISYDCRIQTTGDDAFNVANFLDWLAQESIKQIESGKGAVVGQRYKVGRRFHIEYAQDGFTGRLEVYADVTGKDQMSLDVEITESSRTCIDPSKANKAEVVLRVRLVRFEGCNKYCWPEVEILKMLQNKSGFSFKKSLTVAHYSWEPGIPEGESTIYLERYNPKRNDLWKLLNGSGKEGVSHAIPSPRKGQPTE